MLDLDLPALPCFVPGNIVVVVTIERSKQTEEEPLIQVPLQELGRLQDRGTMCRSPSRVDKDTTIKRIRSPHVKVLTFKINSTKHVPKCRSSEPLLRTKSTFIRPHSAYFWILKGRQNCGEKLSTSPKYMVVSNNGNSSANLRNCTGDLNTFVSLDSL